MHFDNERAVIVWLLDLQLPMQPVSITTDVVSSNLDQGKVYNIMAGEKSADRGWNDRGV
jgi:hypothetical protein